MISKKKKIIILAGMVALLVITGVLNVYLNANADGGPIETGGEVYTDFFSTFKADRQASRDQTILYLNSIINNPASSEETLAEAQSLQLEIASHMTVENNLEQQLKGLGYNNVAITSSAAKVTIILKADDLSTVEIAQILQFALAESKKTPSDIRIVPVS